MQFYTLIYKYWMIATILALIGFVGGFTYIKLQPEKWTSTAEMIPVDTVDIENNINKLFIEEFKVSQNEYEFLILIDRRRVDTLFKTFKFMVTTQSEKANYLADFSGKNINCLKEVLESIATFEPETNVDLLTSFRFTATAGCREVSRYFDQYISNAESKILLSLVSEQIEALRKVWLEELTKLLERSRQLSSALELWNDSEKIEIRKLRLFEDEEVEIKYVLNKSGVEKEAMEINSRITALNRQLDSINKYRDKNEVQKKILLGVDKFGWLYRTSESFISSKQTDFRVACMYGFSLASLFLIMFYLAVMLKAEFTEK